METLLLIPLLKTGASIDGRLDEEAYKNALKITRFYPVFPENSEPFPGEVYVFHDGKNLYVAFRFYEPYGVRANPYSGIASGEIWMISYPSGWESAPMATCST